MQELLMNKPSNRHNEGSYCWNEVWELILFLLGHILIWCVVVVSLGLLGPKAHADEEIGLSEVTHGDWVRLTFLEICRYWYGYWLSKLCY
jgi:hypothetical protein